MYGSAANGLLRPVDCGVQTLPIYFGVAQWRALSARAACFSDHRDRRTDKRRGRKKPSLENGSTMKKDENVIERAREGKTHGRGGGGGHDTHCLDHGGGAAARPGPKAACAWIFTAAECKLEAQSAPYIHT